MCGGSSIPLGMMRLFGVNWPPTHVFTQRIITCVVYSATPHAGRRVVNIYNPFGVRPYGQGMAPLTINIKVIYGCGM